MGMGKGKGEDKDKDKDVPYMNKLRKRIKQCFLALPLRNEVATGQRKQEGTCSPNGKKMWPSAIQKESQWRDRVLVGRGRTRSSARGHRDRG